MRVRSKIMSLLLSGVIIVSGVNISFADGMKVVTLGKNISEEQKAKVMEYFGVKEDEVMIIEVNNEDERKYLGGVASEAQLGKKTFSCAFVEPTGSGGIQVKTANLTWVTSNMIASTLVTCGVENANVLAMSPIKASSVLGH